MAKFLFNNPLIFLIILNSLIFMITAQTSVSTTPSSTAVTTSPSSTAATTSQPSIKSIKISIKMGNITDVFELSEVKVDHLFNPHQKIYKIGSNLEHVLEFNAESRKFYRNESSRSAVLVWNNLINGIVGEKYVLKFQQCTNIDETCQVTLDPSDTAALRPKREVKKSAGFVDKFSSNLRRTERSIGNFTNSTTFYLESLVIVDILSIGNVFPETVKTNDLPKYYIALVLSYFNAIQMYFTETQFKLNVAGIIYLNHTVAHSNSFCIPDLIKLVDTLKPQINNTFYYDSYDFILYFTDYFVYDVEISRPTTGFLKYPMEGFYASKQIHKFEQNHPLVVANSRLDYFLLSETTHRIFHLIGAYNYIKQNNKTMKKFDNSTIIRGFDVNCHDCFDWNEDFCAYVNKPPVTSLDPVQLVTEEDQCRCHNLESSYIAPKTKTENFCQEGFKCQSGSESFNVTYVLDGTPCGTNQVCWKGACKSIPSSSD